MSNYHSDNKPGSRSRPAPSDRSDEQDPNLTRSAKRSKPNALEPIHENTGARGSNTGNSHRNLPAQGLSSHSRNPERTSRSTVPETQNSSYTSILHHHSTYSDDNCAMDVDSASSSPMATERFTRDNVNAAIDLTHNAGWTEYADDIFRNLRFNEALFQGLRAPAMIEQQTDITPAMRAILVDWLVEVAEEYKLSQQTLFLSVYHVDRILAKMLVPRSQLQLVGVACLLVASKYEEIYPPTIDDYVYIADETYTRRQIMDYEKVVLNVLEFRLSSATSVDFVGRFLSSAGHFEPDSYAYNFTNYLVELTLGNFAFSNYLPSQIAAAAVCLAMYTVFGSFPNRAQFEEETEYHVQDLGPCIAELYHVHKRQWPQPPRSQHPLMALWNKYSKPERRSVSTAVHPMKSLPIF